MPRPSSWRRPRFGLLASVANRGKTPRIFVLAGVNGAGKSSIGGPLLEEEMGSEFFNPDAAAQVFLSARLGMNQLEANAAAWQQGRRLLQTAMDERKDFAFETTLGGTTITSLLKQAMSQGVEVHIWYVGLEGVELHVARVRSRVKLGGHDIPEAKIRERYTHSRANLIDLLPGLTELKVFDNTQAGDPQQGQTPAPKLLLYQKKGRILSLYDLALVPQWAKPILQAAMDRDKRRS
jgi:predicted ABC-type ATPase